MALGEGHDDAQCYNGPKKNSFAHLPQQQQQAMGFHEFLGSPLPPGPPADPQIEPQPGQYPVGIESNMRGDQYPPYTGNQINNVDHDSTASLGGLANAANGRPRMLASGHLGRRQQPRQLIIHNQMAHAEIQWCLEHDAVAPETKEELGRDVRRAIDKFVLANSNPLPAGHLPIRPTPLLVETICRSNAADVKLPAVQPGPTIRFANEKGKKQRLADLEQSPTSSPSEEEAYFIPTIETRQICLNDEKAIKQHYEEIFKSIQQLALKAILKEWIKEIEPKKQKNFPYKKDILPDWWPRETKFTEPDHIKIVDRVNVGLSIIDWVQGLSRFEGRGLERLEGAIDRMLLQYEDEETERHLFRRTLLVSLFELAKAHREVINGERDATDVMTVEVPKKFVRPKKQRPRKASKKSKRRRDFACAQGEDEMKLNASKRGTKRGHGDIEPQDNWTKPVVEFYAQQPAPQESFMRTIRQEPDPQQARELNPQRPPFPQEGGLHHMVSEMAISPQQMMPQRVVPSPTVQIPSRIPQADNQSPTLQAEKHQMVLYSQQYHSPPSVVSAYPSFNGGVMEGTPSPMTPYSTAGNMQMMYASSSSQPMGLGVGFQGATSDMIHGLPDHGEMMNAMMLPHRPHTTVYNATTNGQRWGANPGYTNPQDAYSY